MFGKRRLSSNALRSSSLLVCQTASASPRTFRPAVAIRSRVVLLLALLVPRPGCLGRVEDFDEMPVFMLLKPQALRELAIFLELNPKLAPKLTDQAVPEIGSGHEDTGKVPKQPGL